MARKKSLRTAFLYVVVLIFFFASLYHHHIRDAVCIFSTAAVSNAGRLHLIGAAKNTALRRSATPPTTAVLVHDWEVLVILSPEAPPPPNLDGYSCLFQSNDVSPAKFSGVLPFPDRVTFTCLLPPRARRRLPFKQPLLLRTTENSIAAAAAPRPPPLPRWSNLVYDSLTTDDDVVLFAKGVNTRQGYYRHPSEFRCVFGDGAVRTAVTSSKQEVFRCGRPTLTLTAVTSFGGKAESLKVSLEIVAENMILPSVAYYTPPRKLAPRGGRALLCAATMVYGVAKFLKEWVLYHSKIGVERFLLYDNGSDDGIAATVGELVAEGIDVHLYSWRWPKTQEAGFSHSVLYARDACTWMMYLDVDEFVYSPSWLNLSGPSTSLLGSRVLSSSNLGQISVNCREFGPSDREVHPEKGVINGYDCRRRLENRHKSIVRLDAVDEGLVNVIHHFMLKEGYKTKKVNTTAMVVNHYKYQAWPEFKAKFRRRVSAYVLDWTQKTNPKSNDRTPGLGFSPVEPAGWPQKFCEVRDEVLKDLVVRWFGIESEFGIKMAWEKDTC